MLKEEAQRIYNSHGMDFAVLSTEERDYIRSEVGYPYSDDELDAIVLCQDWANELGYRADRSDNIESIINNLQHDYMTISDDTRDGHEGRKIAWYLWQGNDDAAVEVETLHILDEDEIKDFLSSLGLLDEDEDDEESDEDVADDEESDENEADDPRDDEPFRVRGYYDGKPIYNVNNRYNIRDRQSRAFYYIQGDGYDMIVSDDGKTRRVLRDNDDPYIFSLEPWDALEEVAFRWDNVDDSDWDPYRDTVEDILNGEGEDDPDEKEILAVRAEEF